MPSNVFSLSKTFSGLYCLMVISTYLSVTVNKMTHTSLKVPEMEAEFIMLYLYSVSSLFLLYFLLYLARSSTSFDNIKSHGSGFLRQGALVFGLGSFVYHLLEFIEYFIIDLHPDCYQISSTMISSLSLLFVILQVVVVILYPRLNINLGHGLPHFGLMHLVATNLVIWLRTVIKETLHQMEANHFTQKEKPEHGHHSDSSHHGGHKPESSHHAATDLDLCREKYHDDDFVSGVLNASSPFLYAFIIEFSLVGGTVFYNTWNNIHQLKGYEVPSSLVRKVVSKTHHGTSRAEGFIFHSYS